MRSQWIWLHPRPWELIFLQTSTRPIFPCPAFSLGQLNFKPKAGAFTYPYYFLFSWGVEGTLNPSSVIYQKSWRIRGFHPSLNTSALKIHWMHSFSVRWPWSRQFKLLLLFDHVSVTAPHGLSARYHHPSSHSRWSTFLLRGGKGHSTEEGEIQQPQAWVKRRSKAQFSRHQ